MIKTKKQKSTSDEVAAVSTHSKHQRSRSSSDSKRPARSLSPDKPVDSKSGQKAGNKKDLSEKFRSKSGKLDSAARQMSEDTFEPDYNEHDLDERKSSDKSSKRRSPLRAAASVNSSESDDGTSSSSDEQRKKKKHKHRSSKSKHKKQKKSTKSKKHKKSDR